jgi:hypothetical protein
MQPFEQLYESRADYLFFLCQRLEESEERVELLFMDVWRRIRRDFLQLSGEAEEKWLCRKLVESHRRIYRKYPPEEGTGVESSLMTAVTSLGLEFRWPLVLKESVDFSYGELAEILSIPEPTVRTRIARARVQIRRHMEGTTE